MESAETLHSFVLNLLSSAEAREAFQLNPEAVLGDAGLGDIDALDVQEVIPLVIDYAPLSNVADLDAALTEMMPAALDVGHAGAIHQLQIVTQHLPVGPAGGSSIVDANVASIGALAAGPGGLTAPVLFDGSGSATVDATATSGTSSEFSADYDVTGDLDGDLLTVPPLGGDLTGVVTNPGDLLGGAVDPSTGTVTDLLGDATGMLSGLPASLSSVTGTLDGIGGTLDGIGGTLDGAGGALTGTVDGVAGTLDGLTASIHTGASLDAGATALVPQLPSLEATTESLPVGDVLDSAGVGTVTGTVDQVVEPLDGLLNDLPL